VVNARLTKLILLGLLGLGLLLTTYAYAVELNGVSLSPTNVDKSIKPGESFEQIFNVQNRTGEPIKLQAYLQDFRVENNQWIKVENPDPRWSPMTWATIVSAPEKLGHMEEGQVRVKFNVPKDAEMGEHVTYFNAKFIPAVDQQEAKATGITVASEIRSLVYVKVTDTEGNLDLKPGWRLNKAGTGFWHFSKPVFTVAAANTGNVHLEVRGNIVIKDGIRNQKTELVIPLFNVLPGTEKRMDVVWNEVPFFGYFQGKMQLTYDGNNFEEREFSFIYLPLLTFIGIVVTVLGIILAVALYIRQLQKRLAAAEQRQNNNPGGEGN